MITKNDLGTRSNQATENSDGAYLNDTSARDLPDYNKLKQTLLNNIVSKENHTDDSSLENGQGQASLFLDDITDIDITGVNFAELISKKYNNDPLLLIKHLSFQLSLKEEELRNVNKANFTRERNLYSLISKYSSLSTLEIDHKLNEMMINGGDKELTKKNVSSNSNSVFYEEIPSTVENASQKCGGINTGDNLAVNSDELKVNSIGDDNSSLHSFLKRENSNVSSLGSRRSISAADLAPTRKSNSKFVSSGKEKIFLSGEMISKDEEPDLKSSATGLVSWVKNLTSFTMNDEMNKATITDGTNSKVEHLDLLSTNRLSNSFSSNSAKFFSDTDLSKKSTRYKRNTSDNDLYRRTTSKGSTSELKPNNKALTKGKSKSKPNSASNDTRPSESSDVDNSEGSRRNLANSSNHTLELETMKFESSEVRRDLDTENLLNSSKTLVDVEPKSTSSENVDKYGFYTESLSVKSPLKSSGSNQAILINDRKSYLQSIGQLVELSRLHDSTTLKYSNQWDSLSNEVSIHYRKLTSKHENNNEFANNSLEKYGVNGLNILKYCPKQTLLLLINLIHSNGIPEHNRHEFWLQMSGASNLRINGEYTQLVKDIKDYLSIDDEQIQLNINQINLDTTRTFKSNVYFYNKTKTKPGPHFYSLERILYAFVAYKPQIGYFQGMNKIVGNLLVLMSYHNNNTKDTSTVSLFTEEDIFWIFIGLIEEILPRYNTLSFYNGLLNIKDDQLRIHQIYLKEYLPNLYTHVENLAIHLDLITMNWWLSLFIDLRFINLETWFKLFDLLIIGDTIKYQNSNSVNGIPDNEIRKLLKLVALTLSMLSCLEPFLLTLQDKASIYRFLDANNSSKFYDEKHQEIRIFLKYSDIVCCYDDFLNRIDFKKLKL